MFKELFQALQNSSLAQFIGQLDNTWGILAQFFHIAGLILVLLSVVLVNLRLLGFGLLAQSSLELATLTRPWVICGLGFLVLSGFFMLAPSASLYYPNPALWFKLCAFLVALTFQFFVARWILSSPAPSTFLTKAFAITSIFIWFLVGLAGRAIGFMAA